MHILEDLLAMTFRYRTCVLLMSAALLVSTEARAQSRTLDFGELRAGACAVIVKLPEANAPVGRLTIDDGEVALKKVTKRSDYEVEILLESRLRRGDVLRVELRSGGSPKEAIVERGLNRESPCENALKKKSADDREVFELDGFIGLAIDNFAPKEVAGYPPSAASTRNRRTFGVIGQYRLLGNVGDRQQLWLAGASLNGLRTADIDCTQPDQAVLCKDGRPDVSGRPPADVQAASIQVMEHAETLEAHIELRYEFWTLQPDSATPAKAFVFFRHGFIDLVDPVITTATSSSLPSAPTKALSSKYVGIGGLIPSGHFRNSGMTFGIANEDIFGTSLNTNRPNGWNRLKFNGIAIFDVLPQLSDYTAGRWLGFGSWRFFIALDVDRDRFGHGPDAIQTYLGFAFDLSKAFHL
jgi:hypothetical protein